jgi:hypothetical protein
LKVREPFVLLTCVLLLALDTKLISVGDVLRELLLL